MGILITFIILIFSAIVHEVSHGLIAERLGDSTARDEGRITLNPVPHIDPIGTILVPLLIYAATGGRFWLGAAKPVPVNFNNLRDPKRDMALVSLAGPLSNFLLAAVFALIIRTGLSNVISYPILLQAVVINIMLGVFNLIPIPPLDGSKIIASFLPDKYVHTLLSFERWGFILVLLFVYSGLWVVFLYPVLSLFSKLFGLDFGF